MNTAITRKLILAAFCAFALCLPFTLEEQRIKAEAKVEPAVRASAPEEAAVAVSTLLYAYNSSNNHLVSFDANTPGTLITDIPLTGLNANEVLLGIDFRLGLGGLLYGIASVFPGLTNDRVVTINTTTGATIATPGMSLGMSDVAYGVDFEPLRGFIRQTGEGGGNRRLTDLGGLLSTDTRLAYVASDVGAGTLPNVVHIAYGVPDSIGTKLFGIDRARNALVRIGGEHGTPSADTGQLTTIGPLGVTIGSRGGFDIHWRTSEAFAALAINGVSQLCRINLTTGAATVIGTIGNGTTIDGLAILPNCAYLLTPRVLNLPLTGGNYTVTVAGDGDCPWKAVSNVNWITVVAGATGTGNGTVFISVAPNAGADRTGTLTIDGQTVTVTQSSACNYNIAPTAFTAAASGGSNSVNVTAGNGCSWMAVSNASWLSILSGASGTGNGAVTYGVSFNAGPARTGTLTIAGQIFKVMQASPTCAAITVNAAGVANGTVGTALTLNFTATGGAPAYTFAVSAGALPPGLRLNNSGALSGTPTGAGTFNFTVRATDTNGCQGTRTFTLTIAPSAVASVSAASYLAGAAPESIVAGFGVKLASATQVANVQPLPTTLANVKVNVIDSVGTTRAASLFFVSPEQINYLLPAGTAAGTATINVLDNNQLAATGTLAIANVAPGLFAANANGQGVAAAVALRVKADGSLSYEPISQFQNNQFVTKPLSLGPTTDQVFLVLYGTGVRFRSNLSAVVAALGGNVNAEVLFAGESPGFTGLDQLNLRIPRSLLGRNEIEVTVMADGKKANTVRVNIQ